MVLTVIADVAEATGYPERVVRDELGLAAVADAIVLIVLARFWPQVPAERLADVAGVTQAELSTAIKRYHLHHQRAQTATVVAHRAGTRKRHVPVGDPPSPEHRWCKRSSHWVHQDEMSLNASRADGYGDWCKPCWRDYWATKVASRRKKQKAAAAVTPPEPRKARRISTGPTCVECKSPMVDLDGQPRCVTEPCSIGVRNRRRFRLVPTG